MIWSPYHYYATLIEVKDPDTFRIQIDKGLDDYRNITIRLYETDGPEIRLTAGVTLEEKLFGLELRDELRAMMPVGSPLEVTTIKDRTEKYGRYLGIIYFNGLNINDHVNIRAAEWRGSL